MRLEPASPKITVITVVRNGLPFIEQTIKSVLEQSYQSLEYIVIDGGSTDGTLEVIRSYETKISKWISEKDEGIADAFNKGLLLATGDYVLFLNSDDALAGPDILNLMADEMVKQNYPALLYGDCNLLERNSGHLLGKVKVIFSQKILRRGGVLPHPSLFSHRSYFKEYGMFDPHFTIAMDYEWMLRGASNVRVIHVPILVTNVRGGGISTLNRSKVVDEIIFALKKNRYISSYWGELEMRAYFFARSLARKMLEGIGLYKVFSYIRNKNR